MKATKPQLEAELASRGLSTTGTKADLIKRLEESDAATPDRGEEEAATEVAAAAVDGEVGVDGRTPVNPYTNPPLKSILG
jgi:hypothetical protein